MGLPYRISAIEEILPGIAWLLHELHEPIAGNDYSVILGDDTSGRIPALLIGKVINSYNKEHGLPSIPVRFVQGSGRDEDREQVFSAVEDRLNRLPATARAGRVLVVTEGISSGKSIAHLGAGITASGMEFDVAALDGTGFSRDTTQKGRRRFFIVGKRAQVVEDEVLDFRGWPRTTRLYCGLHNAHAIRDREDLTGLSTEKYSEEPVLQRDPVLSARICDTRHDIRRAANDLHNAMDLKSHRSWELVTPMVELLSRLAPAIHKDEIGAVIGDDTSGRYPALVVGRAINAYRVHHGLPKIPVLFIEGTRQEPSDKQRFAFERIRPALQKADVSKRVLVVSDNVCSGRSIKSIIDLAAVDGFTSDVAIFGPCSPGTLRFLKKSNVWPNTVRAFSGGGNPDLLINQVAISGLSQDRKKYSARMVETEKSLASSAHDVRRDIQQNLSDFVDAIEHPLALPEPSVMGLVPRAIHELKRIAVRAEDAPVSGILVGDVAGRVPALLIRSVLNEERRIRGEPPVPITFLPDKAKPEQVSEALNTMSSDCGEESKKWTLVYVAGNRSMTSVLENVAEVMKSKEAGTYVVAAFAPETVPDIPVLEKPMKSGVRIDTDSKKLQAVPGPGVQEVRSTIQSLGRALVQEYLDS